MNDLDARFEQLKQFANRKCEKDLKSKIFSGSLTAKYVNSLPQNLLTLGHVILHTQATYKKPFTDLDKIKQMHDLIALKLDNHLINDFLDENND